jgi:hypothetical protein
MGELRRYRTLASDSALWESFAFRPGDIVISPPGKCGTTWMQMLCALLVFGEARFDRPLSALSPWVDALFDDHAAVTAVLEAQRHRRFLKTHTPLDGLPRVEGVTYVCVGRDPRDVCLSFDHHMANVSPAVQAAMEEAAGAEMPVPPDDPVERFWLWADAPLMMGELMNVNLASMILHVRSFWDHRDEPDVALFHYDDLLIDLPGQLRRLAGVLGIDVDDELVGRLAAAATFDRMRERADELAPHADADFWVRNRDFFHRGASGQWRDVLGPDDVARYRRRLAELAPPDLAAWLEAGWLRSPAGAPAPGLTR